MQIFHRASNPVSRASIVLVVLFVGGLLVVYDRLYVSPYVTQRHTARLQPVPFSHEHHVRGLGIDCRYCHTTAEQSSFAGIPPVHTCMTCHSQIWTNAPMLEPVREAYRTGRPLRWARVNWTPDFVYFDHSIHVAKGIGCTTCHGAIGDMPLVSKAQTFYMKWCLDCHRRPEKFVRPREAVFDVDYQAPKNQAELGARLVKQYDIRRETACTTCHR